MKQVSDLSETAPPQPLKEAVTSVDAEQSGNAGQPVNTDHTVHPSPGAVVEKSSDAGQSAEGVKHADTALSADSAQAANTDDTAGATTPADASQPTDASVPEAPVKPRSPLKRPAILKRLEAARRAEAMKRAEAAKNAEAAKRTDAAKSVEAVKDVDAAKSAEAAMNVDATASMDPAEITGVVVPADAHDTPEMTPPVDATQPLDAVRPAATKQPADGAGPDFIAPAGSTAQVPDIVVPRNHLVTGLSGPSSQDQTAQDTIAKPISGSVTQSEGSSPDTQPSVTATVVSPVVAGPKVVPPPKQRQKDKAGVLVTILSIVAALVLVSGVGAVGVAYFGSHAKPGTQLAGFNITGFSQAQVRDVAQTLVNNYKATLELDGHQAVATAQDLGVTFDLDKTVSNAMNAGSTRATTAQFSPFTTKDVPLVMAVDHKKLQDLLDTTFIAKDQRSVPASISYDADQQKFVAVPGKAGLQADEPQVAQELAYGQGIESALQVATKQEQPEVGDTDAQTAADTANKRLAAPYVLTAGSKTYTIPVATIAGWTVFTPDPASTALKVGIDTAQVAADLPDLLKGNLTTVMTPQQTLLRPDGEVLGIQQNGAAGTSLTDPDSVISSVSDALVAGTGLNLAVDTTTEPATSETVPMDDKYLVPNGEKWVEVNLTNFTATRWEGTTAVSTWSVVIGLPGTPTHPGIFHVWLKVALQDMSGPGYLAKNVPWIAYFDGDIAIHGNYWVSSFGHAASHGCVGLPPDLAKTMYDWIDTGTLVVVHN
ncbi:MAG: L,D-transpeptidase family protein [Propionibacteriaceae bacterium]|nr:L,D-transpeptidase family protein [Propionibacteriaceae bacterium]